MKCSQCGRELREDSKFCDNCGAKIRQREQFNTVFDTRLLIGGIILSILLTLIVTGLAKNFGIPLIFGGLFLPFFWQIKRQQKQNQGD